MFLIFLKSENINDADVDTDQHIMFNVKKHLGENSMKQTYMIVFFYVGGAFCTHVSIANRAICSWGRIPNVAI